MSAERMLQGGQDSSLLERPLTWLTRGVLRAPRAVVAGGIVLTVAAVFVTVQWLGFRTSRLDLLNPNCEYNQRWLAYIEEFGDQDDVLLVVEGAQRDAVTAAIDELEKELTRDGQRFEAVLAKRDFSQFKAKGLHFAPPADLERIEQLLQQFAPLLRGDWGQLDPGRFLEGIQQQIKASRFYEVTDAHLGAESHQQLSVAIERFCASLTGAFADRSDSSHPSDSPSPWQELNALRDRFRQFDPQYLLSDDGRMGFVVLRLAQSEQKLVVGGPEIAELRRVTAEVKRRHPAVKIGVTGMPVLEFDEMHSSQEDMTIASIVSLAGVVGLLLVGFGNWRYTLLTVATLILGMAWSFGFVTVGVGHLNILSISFAAILIGLGIDFGIHYIARYLHLRSQDESPAVALEQTAAGIGPGVITGAVTTACAFFTAGLTDFTGVAELGIIAGGGILICLLAALVVLPAMVLLLDRGRFDAVIPPPLPLATIVGPLLRMPRLVIAAFVVLTLLAVPGLSRLRYDHNLLNLQARGLESVDLEMRLMSDSDRSVFYAVSMSASRTELLQRKAEFEKLASVEHTEQIVSLVPEFDAAAGQAIERIHAQLSRLPVEPPVIPVASSAELLEALRQLELVVAGLSGSDGMGPMGQMGPMGVALRRLRERIAAIPPAEFSRRLAAHQQRVATELLANLQALQNMSNPTAPQWDDVPPALTNRFVGRSGTHLLRVYARGNIWDMDSLTRFVRDVEAIDPRATGHPIQTFYASRQMQRSYLHAAIYSFLALLIVLVLDFRSIGHSLLALAPLVLGVVQTVGLLGLLDIPFNAANMIVLPLILGIGIDNGVHVVHDFRTQTGRYRLSNSTAVAIVLCSSTTMVGFCTMMFARHQGLRSLGQVLTIGVFCCLVTSLFFLPALLSWLTRNRDESARGDERNDEADADDANDRSSAPPARPARRSFRAA